MPNYLATEQIPRIKRLFDRLHNRNCSAMFGIEEIQFAKADAMLAAGAGAADGKRPMHDVVINALCFRDLGPGYRRRHESQDADSRPAAPNRFRPSSRFLA